MKLKIILGFILLFNISGCVDLLEAGEKENISKFEKILEKEPNNIETHMDLLGCYFRMDKSDEALKVYQSKLLKEPNNSVLHFAVGYIYNAEKKHEIALKNLFKAKQFGLKSKWLDYELGTTYFFLGKYEKTIKKLETFVLADNKVLMAYEILVVCNAKLKKDEKALKWAYKAIELNPKTSSRSTAGLMLVRMGKLKEAISLLEKGVSIDPSFLKDNEYISALSIVYIKSARRGKNNLDGNIILMAGKKHPELLKDKKFKEFYSKAIDVMKKNESSVKLPRSVRGITLGQSLSEVDKIAKERKLAKNIYFSEGVHKDSRLYDIRHSDPDFISLSVKLVKNKVVKIEATYNKSIGEYKKIIALAEKKFGKPIKRNHWENKGFWHWKTLWLGQSTIVKIYANSENKSRAYSPEFTIIDRKFYEEDEKKKEIRRREILNKKAMFGGD
ncbi:MAG: hypothetical protein KAR84_05550 [Elusimicrobiales bacterium]|nr:hypothetical protein [Elusimicrobiales bacterium]